MSDALHMVHTVLNTLTEPAFLARENAIVWANSACRQVGLQQGDVISALLPPMECSGSCSAWETSFRGSLYSVSLQKLGDDDLYLLRKSQDDQSEILLAAVRGFRPALEELVEAGNQLLPQIEEYEDETLQAGSAAICRAGFRFMRSVDAITAFHRLSREETVLQRETSDLQVFFDDLAARITDALRDAGLSLSYTGPKTSVHGTLDRQEVTSAVLQLISNAAKFSDGSPISLSVQVLQKQLHITVCGSGETMEPDVLSTAFCRWRKGTEDTDPRVGAGLGLALVQAVARRHGGNALISAGGGKTEVRMVLDVSQPEMSADTPKQDFTGGYDPVLVELSCILPASTYDSRNVDL